jgi:uncharacterized membrane protein
MVLAYKLIPLLVGWVGIMLVLARGFSGRRLVAATSGSAGFAGGMAGAFALLHFFTGDTPFAFVKMLLGVLFLLLWTASVVAVYRRPGHDASEALRVRWSTDGLYAAVFASIAGVAAGVVWACCFAGSQNQWLMFSYLGAVAVAIAVAVSALERFLPDVVVVSPVGMVAAVCAFLFFSSSSSPRLDLFAPLTMKVMKFAHDFVHQFFESMLIPDHLFFTSRVWNIIGFLFGNGIGFWGALIIWVSPVLLVMFALGRERLPLVAHIRQGAQRRRLLADALRMRRLRLVIPLVAFAACGGAVYESYFPSVEYWDPKPLSVTASPSGEIVIPKNGEINLEDGKLHKYIYKRSSQEVRFFIVMTPARKLTAVLDACSICKPDGYGQTEGVVICYYCKTLIPLETVGRPGGCNPVPIPFVVREDGVHIDGLTLVNMWSTTVQSTTRVKKEGK